MIRPCDPLVSVVMPVYNVEAFIDRAVRSILSQTLQEWELLLIDDGSTDSTGEKADAFAAQDPRIRVLHQKNAGAAAARNAAVDMARGKYLFFSDGDDWAEPGMLQKMTDRIGSGELLVCGFYIDSYYSHDRFDQEIRNIPDVDYDSAEAFRQDAHRLFDKNLLYAPWNKIYLTERVRELGLRFPDTYWDDFPFVLSYIRDVSSVRVMSDAFYHFTRAREESETARHIRTMFEKREEEHGWMTDLYTHWGVTHEDGWEMIARRYVERFIGCVENVTNPKAEYTRRERIAEIRRMLGSENLAPMLKLARPRTLMMRAMLIPVRLRSAHLTYLEGAFISRVRMKNARLFARLKSRR